MDPNIDISMEVKGQLLFYAREKKMHNMCYMSNYIEIAPVTMAQRWQTWVTSAVEQEAFILDPFHRVTDAHTVDQ